KKKALLGHYILSIYFHNPSKKEFSFAVRWLKKNGFSFISLEDLKKIKDGSIPFPKASVLLTVDDGWASNVSNIAAVADDEKVPVAIFVATEAIEEGNFWFRYAKAAKKQNLGFPSTEQMKKLPNHERLSILSSIQEKLTLPREAMTVEDVGKISASNWITIGGHSHSHPILPQCDNNELYKELNACKDKLQRWLNREVDAFAYPNGDFNESVVNATKALGYKLEFANNPAPLTPNALSNPFAIPRLGFLEGASEAENICPMVGIWSKISK